MKFIIFLCILCHSYVLGGSAAFQSWLNRIVHYETQETINNQEYFDIECLHQDYGKLEINRSCHTLTPLKIGSESFERGLGSHSNGQLRVTLHQPAKRFIAEVGIDNNANTQGCRGSVRFYIKDMEGNILGQTGICKGGQQAVHLEADIFGLKQFDIVIDDAGDGIRHDQTDIADAKIELEDGTMLYLDKTSWLDENKLPFTFVYGGEKSQDLLIRWDHRIEIEKRGDLTEYNHIWLEPGKGLKVVWVAKVFNDFQAFESKLFFENIGQENCRILENVNVLDQKLASSLKVYYSSGGRSGVPANGFVPQVWDGQDKMSIGGVEGLSSGKYLPFWLASKSEEGLFYGIGWTGQWNADFVPYQGGVAISAGMQHLCLELMPGEKISQPTVLMGSYSGDYFAGYNAVRSILYKEYTPTLGGERFFPPVSWNHWFTFTNNINKQNLSEQIKVVKDLGIEYFCVDAGWFMTDFWHVGDWRVNPHKFPDGLEPIAKVIKNNGMKMGLWFEPERVTEKAYDAFEHKEWLLPAADGQPYMYHGDTPINVWLLDLTIPAAQDWVVDMIGDYVTRLDLKWIRYDFNYKFIKTWLADSKDNSYRVGMKEIRYVEGLYNVLDKLIENHPDLVIEWCAGGGRRIDLETIRRSHTFWKSDLTGIADQTRPHLTGGNLFLPANYLNSNLRVLDSEYDYLGQFGGALGFNHDFRLDNVSQLKEAAKMIEKYKEIRPLLLENYYPLFKYSSDLNNWDGWQFHDSKENRGCLIAFRPQESPYVTAKVKFRRLEGNSVYRLKSTIGEVISEQTTGEELMNNFEIELKNPRSAILIEYHAVK
ncbi:MAG: alpha-galactosidase [Sedimentisphaeraceae bacterium JB056]